MTGGHTRASAHGLVLRPNSILTKGYVRFRYRSPVLLGDVLLRHVETSNFCSLLCLLWRKPVVFSQGSVTLRDVGIFSSSSGVEYCSDMGSCYLFLYLCLYFFDFYFWKTKNKFPQNGFYTTNFREFLRCFRRTWCFILKSRCPCIFMICVREARKFPHLRPKFSKRISV